MLKISISTFELKERIKSWLLRRMVKNYAIEVAVKGKNWDLDIR